VLLSLKCVVVKIYISRTGKFRSGEFTEGVKEGIVNQTGSKTESDLHELEWQACQLVRTYQYKNEEDRIGRVGLGQLPDFLKGHGKGRLEWFPAIELKLRIGCILNEWLPRLIEISMLPLANDLPMLRSGWH
jgi:hypothetical protein